jgi:hypothetical protein
LLLVLSVAMAAPLSCPGSTDAAWKGAAPASGDAAPLPAAAAPAAAAASGAAAGAWSRKLVKLPSVSWLEARPSPAPLPLLCGALCDAARPAAAAELLLLPELSAPSLALRVVA